MLLKPVQIHGNINGILVGFTEIVLLIPQLFFIGHYFNDLHYTGKKLFFVDAHVRTQKFVLQGFECLYLPTPMVLK